MYIEYKVYFDSLRYFQSGINELIEIKYKMKSYTMRRITTLNTLAHVY